MRSAVRALAVSASLALPACGGHPPPAPEPPATSAPPVALPPPASPEAGAPAAEATATPDAPFRQQPPDPTAAAPFAVPAAQPLKLKSGIAAYLVPLASHLAAVRIVAAGGVADAPLGRAEIVDVMTAAMHAGTKGRSVPALESAYMSAGMPTPLITHYDDGIVVSGVSTADKLALAANVVADVALHPAFAADDVARVGRQRASQYADPAPLDVAGRVMLHVLFGTRPYGNVVSSSARLQAVTSQDVVAMHRREFSTKRLTIVVTGGVSAADATRALDDAIGTPPPAGSPLPAARPVLAPLTAARIVVVDRPGAQPAVLAGFVGPAAGTPDETSAIAALQLLGDPSTGRLTLKLRDQTNLVPWLGYWTYASREGGVLSLRARAEVDHVGPLLTEIEKAVEGYGAGGVSEDDVSTWRERTAFEFESSFATAPGGADRYAFSFLEGRPAEAVAAKPDRVHGVTLATVQRAAAQWLDPARMRVVVVGDWAALRAPLEALGWGPIELRDTDGRVVKGAGHATK